jgi:hypothetical protein
VEENPHFYLHPLLLKKLTLITRATTNASEAEYTRISLLSAISLISSSLEENHSILGSSKGAISFEIFILAIWYSIY